MAKIRPISGLDSDIESIALNKAETIIIRDEATSKVEILAQQENIYTSIKRITMSLGFSVKEVEFCERMINECNDISQKDFPQADLENVARDKQEYMTRENEAKRKIQAKTVDLNRELEKLRELAKGKDKYLTDDVVGAMNRIIEEIEEFKKALELDKIKEESGFVNISTEPASDDFSDLEDFLSGSVPKNNIFDEKVLSPSPVMNEAVIPAFDVASPATAIPNFEPEKIEIANIIPAIPEENTTSDTGSSGPIFSSETL